MFFSSLFAPSSNSNRHLYKRFDMWTGELARRGSDAAVLSKPKIVDPNQIPLEQVNLNILQRFFSYRLI